MRSKTKTISFTIMFTTSMAIIMGLVYWANIDRFTEEKSFSFERSLPQKRISKTWGYYKEPIINFKDKTMVTLGDFTTNMAADDPSSKFVRVRLEARTSSVGTSEEIVEKNILIRDAIIKSMSQNRFRDIGRAQGKIRLKNEIRHNLNGILTEGEIAEVYFTQFIVQ